MQQVRKAYCNAYIIINLKEPYHGLLQIKKLVLEERKLISQWLTNRIPNTSWPFHLITPLDSVPRSRTLSPILRFFGGMDTWVKTAQWAVPFGQSTNFTVWPSIRKVPSVPPSTISFWKRKRLQLQWILKKVLSESLVHRFLNSTI